MNEKASWHRSQYLRRELIRDFMHAEYPSKDKEWTGGGGGGGGEQCGPQNLSSEGMCQEILH